MIDEVSQIGPRPMLKLLELQARTGMTIKMLGDREQAQAIEAGDSIEILRRALPPEALPELLTTMRQATQRGREIAGLFREGKAEDALTMKRADGHAMLVGGDRDQVVGQIADLYIARRDMLAGVRHQARHHHQRADERGRGRHQPGDPRAAEGARRDRRRARRSTRRSTSAARNTTWPSPPATGCGCFAEPGARSTAGSSRSATTATSWRCLARAIAACASEPGKGEVAEVEWRRLADEETGRLLLGFGHALTIDAAQGITSDEHINALPRGTSGVTGFTSYVAESRSARHDLDA